MSDVLKIKHTEQTDLPDELVTIFESYKQKLDGSHTLPQTVNLKLSDLLELANRSKVSGLLSFLRSQVNYLRTYFSISRSGLFNSTWYKEKYLSGAADYSDALKHYIIIGAEHGFDPSPNFSTKYYLKHNIDVKLSGINPLLHYLLKGRSEGRTCIPTEKKEILMNHSRVLTLTDSALAKIRLNEPCFIHLHCNSIDTFNWVSTCLKHIPINSKVVVSCANQETFDTIKNKAKDFNNLETKLSSFPTQPLLDLLLSEQKNIADFEHICHLHDQIPELAIVATRPTIHDLIQTLLGSESMVAAARLLLNYVPGLIWATPNPLIWSTPGSTLFWASAKQLNNLVEYSNKHFDTLKQIGNAEIYQHLLNYSYNQGHISAIYQKEWPHWLSNYHSKKRPYTSCGSSSLVSTKNKKYVVYTAITENYDQLKLPELIDQDFDFICFTNQHIDGKNIFQIRKLPHICSDPIKQARYIKTHPHILLKEYQAAIWLDSNILIRGELKKYLDLVEKQNLLLGMVPHPCRETIAEEALACVQFTSASALVVAKHISRYTEQVLNLKNLHETGFIVWRHQEPKLHKFLEIWWQEIENFSSRDQLSLGYALDQCNLEVAALMTDYQNVRNSPDFVYFEHGHNNGYSLAQNL